jgi:alcohol dehydrogenase class IV
MAALMSLWPNLLPTPLGLSHSLGYALGSTYGIPHGICSCLTLPGVVSLVSKSLNDSDRAFLAETVSQIPPDLVAAADKAEAPHEDDGTEVMRCRIVGLALGILIERLDLKSNLKSYGVPLDQLDLVAEKGLKSLQAAGAQGLPSKEEIVRQVLEKVYEAD